MDFVSGGCLAFDSAQEVTAIYHLREVGRLRHSEKGITRDKLDIVILRLRTKILASEYPYDAWLDVTSRMIINPFMEQVRDVTLRATWVLVAPTIRGKCLLQIAGHPYQGNAVVDVVPRV